MNYISLLNLPDCMRRFGSLRALWEGDRKGEGGIPKIKAKIKGGTTGNWASNAAKAVLCDTALERAIKRAADTVGANSMDPSVQQLVDAARVITREANATRFRDFVCYKDEEAARAAMQSGDPVSLVILEDGTSGMMLQKSTTFVPVHRDHEIAVDIKCGAAYFGFECQPAVDLVVPRSEWASTIAEQQRSVAKRFVLLLPELRKDLAIPFSGRHYFITSNWEEMDVTGNIVRYRISRARY
jgi:hypothetical protein